MEINSPARRDTLVCSLSVAFLLFCEFFFFRNIIWTDGLIGDHGDGRLTMLVAEHWFHVFQGKAAVPDLGMFYPAANTLAYSDMLLGYGLVHSLLRFMGMDIFYAYKTTLMLIHLLGTFSTFYLLKQILRTDFVWALFGTITFSFSNTYAIHFGHNQLAAIGILPLAAIFALAFFRNLKNRAKRTLYAVFTILTLALVLYTSWYMAFFTALFATTVIFVMLCTTKIQEILPKSKYFLKLVGIDLFFYFLFAIALIVPFVWLSFPVLRMSGGFGRYGFLPYGPEVIDMINVSVNNWLLGPLMRKLGLDSRGYSGEVVEGFNIVLLFSFVVLAYRVYRLNAKQGVCHYIPYKTLVLSVIISLLLVIRLSANGISLWLFVYYLFPGGKAIRAVARYFFFLSLPMSLITAVMGDHLSRLKKRSICPALILLALAFVANIHIGGVSSSWGRSEALKFISQVTPPPDDCSVFYIVNPTRNTTPWAIQLDAYQIADHFGINTINGYSGNTPTGWGNIWEVCGDRTEYEKAVLEWIVSNNLENVYAYDEGNNSWMKFDPPVRD